MEKELLKINALELLEAVMEKVGQVDSSTALSESAQAEKRLGLATVVAAEGFYTESRIRRAKNILGLEFDFPDPTRPPLFHRSSYPQSLEEI